MQLIPALSAMVLGARFLTDFGDQAVLLPLAAGVILVFALSGWRRGALSWTFVIGSVLVLMLLLKLVLLACGHFYFGDRLKSPSGHTAAAAAVYGGLLALAARYVFGHPYWTLACAVFPAALIGATRLSLGVHSGLEVLIGAILGICAALAATVLAGPPPPSLKLRQVAVITAVVAFLFHGLHMPAEAAIKTMSTSMWPLSECR